MGCSPRPENGPGRATPSEPLHGEGVEQGSMLPLRPVCCLGEAGHAAGMRDVDVGFFLLL